MVDSHKNYSEEELKGFLCLAAEKNKVIYDSNSPDIEKRFLYLMFTQCQDDVHSIILPRDVFPNFDFAGTIYGIRFLRTSSLDEDGTLTKYYLNNLGGYLPIGKTSLAIAVGETQLLLGAV